jgi:hypothetical protein
MQRFGADASTRIADVKSRARQIASLRYTAKMEELRAAPGVNRALPLLLVTDDIEKTAKLLDKKFPEPILGCVFPRKSRVVVC